MGEHLSSGSTLLNLACTGDPSGAFPKGKYIFLVGDSASGKTFLSMTCCAEAVLNPVFADYRLIYDNGEDGMLMDLDRLFGEAMADKLEPPEVDANGDPVFSDTIESFYFHLDDAVRKGKPFIYILDSENSLSSESEAEHFDASKNAYRKGKDMPGSYGDGKAKKHSEMLRKALKGLRETGSILIVLSQTRDNITGYGGSKTRSGGRALKFYATIEVWSSVAEQLKKRVNEKDRQVGTRVKLEVKKNRLTGKLPTVEIDIYPSLGIDDLGTCVDYLVEEKFWDETGKGNIKATGLNPGVSAELSRDKLIKIIEKNGLEDRVRELCAECWKAVEEKCAVRRKNRYVQEETTEA